MLSHTPFDYEISKWSLYKALILGLMLFLASGLNALIEQSVENADNLSVGSHFQLIVKYAVPLKQVVVPDTLSSFRVESVEVIKTPSTQDYLKLNISVWESGALSFPRLRVVPAQIFPGDLYTDAFRVYVLPVRGEQDTTLRDIKPLQKYPYQIPYQIYWYALLFSGILVLTILLIHLMRIKPKPKIPAAIAIEASQELPLWQRIINQLDALLGEDLLYRADYKTFCFRLSLTLRNYLEEEYAFSAIEMTQSEIEAYLRKNSLLGAEQEDYIELLRFCDRIKFAKHDTSGTELEQKVSWLKEYLIRKHGSPALAPEQSPAAETIGQDTNSEPDEDRDAD
ncbi:MAG: hypothetical protein PHI68_02945 [Candidatus Cloacimonetes bacterium]|nr:hypothetical protein [Candidatus Cloacimonadota bacterium]